MNITPQEIIDFCFSDRISKQWFSSEKENLAFLYMPFMHSEDLADQELSVKLYRENKLEANIGFAEHHREIIRRFGRFPHRNGILGRVSSEEEIHYLASENAFTG